MTSMSFQRCLFKNINFLKHNFILKNCQQQLILNCAKYHHFTKNHTIQNLKVTRKICLTNNISNKNKNEIPKENPKVSLLNKIKLMYKDYWYVVIPVHAITSAGWFGIFYYLAKSGVDVVDVLHGIGISDTYLKPLNASGMGYIAVAFALYKIATPLRYTVTLGGTTIAIKYLKEMGYIKPVLSKNALKKMYKEQKTHIKETFQETKEELRQRKDQFKRKNKIISGFTLKKDLKDINVNYKKDIEEKTK